jgi:drug/metabolite transporter (DMT)-like permease
VDPDLRRRLGATGLALTAAFLWSSYYAFILVLAPTVRDSGLLVWPFAFGALGYLAWAASGGHLRHLPKLSRSGAAWLRVVLLLAMQLSVLAETFLAGAVDTSLLSLVGDVVLTPILVMLVLREGRERARDAVFLGGVILATGGATLTIIAGGSVRPLGPAAGIVAIIVPVVVALYFLSSAQENRQTPTSAVIAHATMFAALFGVVVSPAVPGGLAGLAFPSLTALGLLAALGLTSFFVAPAAYFQAIERAGLVLPAVLMAAIPVFTLLITASLFHTVPPILALAGVPLAVVGAVLALQGSHPPWSRRYEAGA